MDNSIRRSIFSLAKYNNGKFKSEKQAAFLKRQLKINDGFLGSVSTYGNETRFFAYWDDEGITKIDKHHGTSNRVINFFTRKSDDEFEVEKKRRLDGWKRHYEEITGTWNEQLRDKIEKVERGLNALEGYLSDDDHNMKKIYDDYKGVLERLKKLKYLPKEMPDWWVYDNKRREFYVTNNTVDSAIEALKYDTPDFLSESFKIFVSENLVRNYIK